MENFNILKNTLSIYANNDTQNAAAAAAGMDNSVEFLAERTTPIAKLLSNLSQINDDISNALNSTNSQSTTKISTHV